MEEREISISPLFKWLTKRFDKKAMKVEKPKKEKKSKKVEKVKETPEAKLLGGQEFKTVKKGLDEEQVIDSVNDLGTEYGASIDSLLETIETDTEQEWKDKNKMANEIKALRAKLKIEQETREQMMDHGRRMRESLLSHDASVDPVPETSATDAEQMAASIKMKAQQEAEAEAARIINQAKQEVQEIKLSAEIATEAKLITEKEAEDILSTVKRKTEIIEEEAKQRTLLYLLKAREEIEKQIREDYKGAYARLSSSLQDLINEGQNIEVELKNKRIQLWESKSFELKEYEAALLKTSEEVAPYLETLASMETEIEPDIASKEEETEQPVQLQEEALEEEKTEQPSQLQEEALEKEETEQPVQLQEEATVSEPAEEVTEELLGQHPPEEIPGREETNSTQLKPIDSQTTYIGEVELAIAMPIELKMVSKLYNYLQTIPDIKILRTTGSWDRGTTITVVADKPLPLISIISKIPGVEVISELPQKDDLVKGTSSSRLRAGGKEVKRIKLTLKEAQSL